MLRRLLYFSGAMTPIFLTYASIQNFPPFGSLPLFLVFRSFLVTGVADDAPVASVPTFWSKPTQRSCTAFSFLFRPCIPNQFSLGFSPRLAAAQSFAALGRGSFGDLF